MNLLFWCSLYDGVFSNRNIWLVWSWWLFGRILHCIWMLRCKWMWRISWLCLIICRDYSIRSGCWWQLTLCINCDGRIGFTSTWRHTIIFNLYKFTWKQVQIRIYPNFLNKERSLRDMSLMFERLSSCWPDHHYYHPDFCHRYQSLSNEQVVMNWHHYQLILRKEHHHQLKH